jgi:hypothetical protein
VRIGEAAQTTPSLSNRPASSTGPYDRSPPGGANLIILFSAYEPKLLLKRPEILIPVVSGYSHGPQLQIEIWRKSKFREMQQPTPRPEKLRGGTRYTAPRTCGVLNRCLPRQLFGAIQEDNEIISTLGPSSFSITRLLT